MMITTATQRRLCVLAGLAASAALIGGCGGDDGGGGTVAQGSMTVTGGGIYRGEGDPNGCYGGNDGNRDFRVGLPVVVADASGKVLGSGSLQPGVLQADDSSCTLPFSFSLSGTDDNYQVSFGGRGSVVVQDVGAIDLTYGPQ